MAIDIKKFIARFVEEAREHIAHMGVDLAALEHDPQHSETLNSIFRSAHTIKGSSRMLKLTAITEVAHKLEDVLDALRSHKLSYNADLGRLIYQGMDAISALVEYTAEERELPSMDESLSQALIQAAKGEPFQTSAVAAEKIALIEPIIPSPEIKPVAPVSAPPVPVPAPNQVLEPRLKVPDSVRVPLAKLDNLIKLMGEVVSGHTRLQQRLLDLAEIESLSVDSNSSPENYGKNINSRLHKFSLDLRDDVQAQELLMDELHNNALVMRMLPLSLVFDPIGRMIRELAQSLGKEVECRISGAEIELDRQMIDKLGDPMLHLLSNAVDHGIEAADLRLAAGKPRAGSVTISARVDGGWVIIEITDDGAGIPVEMIREKAVRKSLFSAEKATQLTEQEVIDLIFLPGFSTSAIITNISGRGVGMDVVKRSIVDDLQGLVNVESQIGKGTHFSLRLPVSLAVMRVLLVAVGGIGFGFVAQYVAELLRVPDNELLTIADRQAVIIRNEFVPVVCLEELLKIPAHHAHPKAAKRNLTGLLLLVVKVRNEKLALVVDDLLDECNMVIKPLPKHMRHIALVSGMVTTGKNELVNILHVPVLFEMARKARTENSSGQPMEKSASAAKVYKVLVVDDSLNTREIEKDVLEAYGYQVTLAEDGLDALSKARREEFDAVLTDVEMPNMDGFKLTELLRLEEKYRDKPIIIITSREKEEDKRRGILVGADAYIVKGDFDQSTLVDTLRNLLG